MHYEDIPSSFRPAVYARDRVPIVQWSDYVLPFSHLPTESRIVRTHLDTYATGLGYAESIDPGFATDPRVAYLVRVLAGAIDGTLLSRMTLNRIKLTEGVKVANTIHMMDESDLATISSLRLQNLIAQFMAKKREQETIVAAKVAVNSVQNATAEGAKTSPAMGKSGARHD
ncbi:hypothetical protein IWQ61_006854 [Dispira simplex]|nr:hypothetical protein IWQ61_006854 [Dispira simplex]